MAKAPISPKLIKQLRDEFSKINKIDPDSAAYKRMLMLLSLLNQTQLKIVVDADIKFISLLARNRLKKPIDTSSNDVNAAPPVSIPTEEEEINAAKKKYDDCVKAWQNAKQADQPLEDLVQKMQAAKQEYDDAMTNANKPISTTETSSLQMLKLLMLGANTAPIEHEAPEVAPAAALLAATVEKHRNGHPVTTFELSSIIKRLAFSDLSSDEIADRMTAAFGDVLLTPQD